MSDVINNIIKAKSVYFAWLIAALFYFYQYVLRVSPGIMHHEIRTEFLLTAQQFATMGSIYLLAYSFLQIPLGILMDKYGVKKVILCSAIFCSLGAAMFAHSTSFSMLQLARFFIGMGSASAFMSALKIVADNMPPGNRAILLGMTLTIGVMGALCSGNFISNLLSNTSWREIWWSLALIGIIMFIITYFGIKKSIVHTQTSQMHKSLHSSDMITDIMVVLKNPSIMIYTFLAVGLYTPLSVLADLMGIAFIEQKLSVDNVVSANTTMLLYLGLAIGSITIPYLCERLHIINRGIQLCAIGILISFSMLLYYSNLSIDQTKILLLIIGILCGSEMLCFTAALRVADHNNSGMIIGVINTLNMLGGAILDQLVGCLLDLQWNDIYDINNVRLYSIQNFMITFSSLVLVIGISVIITFFLKKYDS